MDGILGRVDLCMLLSTIVTVKLPPTKMPKKFLCQVADICKDTKDYKFLHKNTSHCILVLRLLDWMRHFTTISGLFFIKALITQNQNLIDYSAW